MSTSTVNVARPLGYLCVAGVLALGALLLPGGRVPAAPPAAAPPAAAPPGATFAAGPTQSPACTGVRESLRPDGPLPAPGAMPSGSTMAAIAQRGRLIAGVDQGKYLAGYRDPQTGQLRGSDIDLVHSIARAILGDPDKVQFVVLDIADRAAALERGEVDVVVDHFTVTCSGSAPSSSRRRTCRPRSACSCRSAAACTRSRTWPGSGCAPPGDPRPRTRCARCR
jgi:polar amino acid transport system substrate-binding protein